jgi:ABC-type polysaccharide/polyol phosphate transport system ATPase subunit
VSSPDVAIELRGVGKRYVKYDDTPMLTTAALKLWTKTRRSTLWAVRDLDLEVNTGECIGVIGRNGAGKSTMLQLLAGVTAPTEGTVAVHGRVAPLISVGVGFHPELTGRENVYVNGMILGLNRRQIDERFDAIVDFSEIGDFIDTPVKFYSSGMYVRLGFAVAIQVQPEVLLVDEVLAVGDFAFQWKCHTHMMNVRESGTTIVIVSHNLPVIRRMCDRVLVLHRGEARYLGPAPEAISVMHGLLGEQKELEEDDGELTFVGGAEVESLVLLGKDGQPTHDLKSGDEAVLRAAVRFDQPCAEPMFRLCIRNAEGVIVYYESTIGISLGTFDAGERATFEARMEMRLGPGTHEVEVDLISSDVKSKLVRPHRLAFFVAPRRMFSGLIDLEAAFGVHRGDDPAEAAAGDA